MKMMTLWKTTFISSISEIVLYSFFAFSAFSTAKDAVILSNA